MTRHRRKTLSMLPEALYLRAPFSGVSVSARPAMLRAARSCTPPFLKPSRRPSEHPLPLQSIFVLVGVRPLHCGSVPRACRNTGIHASLHPTSKIRRLARPRRQDRPPSRLAFTTRKTISRSPSPASILCILFIPRVYSPFPPHPPPIRHPPPSSRRSTTDHRRMPRRSSPRSRLSI